ncbi:Wadjet anti-phage system protein JetD domain-containing protein [Nonomuraea sp. NPDC046802]|uniref:Wadjet anti-phage system protein JetD domain-containing protein n=1 Tax=Nonomuraea sp. NPDC046802 TaxID=3154919 RepID=UPI0033F6DF44
MKTPDQVVADARRRLENTWYDQAVGAGQAWPHKFPLSVPGKKDALESGWQKTIHPLIRTWRDWVAQHPVRLHTASRQVFTTIQDVPSHLEIFTPDDAAAVVGGDWAERLERGRRRAALLADVFPAAPEPQRIIRAADGYTDTDFALLLKAATWFTRNDASGYTPRQVPIPGIHAKWLNTHQPLILDLTGRDTLGLLPAHPSRIHFTYLDPGHRATGGRRHDSATVGDTSAPAYQPDIVIISENKDTAIHFPPLPGGIAVEGDGFGGKAAGAFSWLTSARHLLYWGDIDAYGFEILNGWRDDGVLATSILMDQATYDAYEPFGTNTDRNGKPLQPGVPKPLPHLTNAERAVYQRLLDPALQGHRRIEQERVPLSVANAAVQAAIRDS